MKVEKTDLDERQLMMLHAHEVTCVVVWITAFLVAFFVPERVMLKEKWEVGLYSIAIWFIGWCPMEGYVTKMVKNRVLRICIGLITFFLLSQVVKFVVLTILKKKIAYYTLLILAFGMERFSILIFFEKNLWCYLTENSTETWERLDIGSKEEEKNYCNLWIGLLFLLTLVLIFWDRLFFIKHIGEAVKKSLPMFWIPVFPTLLLSLVNIIFPVFSLVKMARREIWEEKTKRRRFFDLFSLLPKILILILILNYITIPGPTEEEKSLYTGRTEFVKVLEDREGKRSTYVIKKDKKEVELGLLIEKICKEGEGVKGEINVSFQEGKIFLIKKGRRIGTVTAFTGEYSMTLEFVY